MIMDNYKINWAIRNKKAVVFRKAAISTLTWKSFEEIFDAAIKDSKVFMPSFGSLTIDNSEKYSSNIDPLVSQFSTVHPGNKIAALSIVHFYNSHDNTVPEESQIFLNKFIASNPNKLPPNFDFSLLVPSRHSDPVDGFYVQCNGNTMWKFYYQNKIVEYIINPGDVIFIPKDLDHSVESLNVRSSLSISFFDKDN